MRASDGTATTRRSPVLSADRGRGLRHPAKLGVACVVASLALAACSSGGSQGASKGGSITVADVAPFTGADAALGPIYYASCLGATHAINSAGGVEGKTVNCKAVDTRGDPADAVPAVRQRAATAFNRSRRRAVSMSSAPSMANALAAAMPIPLDAPVISTTC